MVLTRAQSHERSLRIANDLTASTRQAKRMLEETDTASPLKKRPKISGEKDVKGRRVKTLKETSGDDTFDTLKQATLLSGTLVVSSTHKNISETPVGGIETTLEQLHSQNHDTNHPSTAEDDPSTSDSVPSNPPSLQNHNPSSPFPPRSSKEFHKDSHKTSSPKPLLSPRSLRRKKAIESSCPWMVVKRSKADRPRSITRSYQPARRSRGGPSSCSSTAISSSATPKPKLEPRPSPSPSTESNDSGRYNFRPRAVPGTKAKRLGLTTDTDHHASTPSTPPKNEHLPLPRSKPSPKPSSQPLYSYSKLYRYVVRRKQAVRGTKAERLAECMKYFPKPPSPTPSPPSSPSPSRSCSLSAEEQGASP